MSGMNETEAYVEVLKEADLRPQHELKEVLEQ